MNTVDTRLNDWLEGPVSKGEGAETWWLLLPLMRLLSRGEPVTDARLAERVKRPIAVVREALDAMPSVERDEHGDIVGFGITLNPTPHRFTLDGDDKVLYAFCAMDTLLFPAILNRTIHIQSTCPATGTPIRVTAGPVGVAEVDPPEAVVSQLTPEEIGRIRADVCSVGHFFASPEAARPWLRAHPDGLTVPVADSAEVIETFTAFFDRQEASGPAC